MSDVWVLGTAAWDLVYELDRMPDVGGSASARAAGRRPGGSSGNVARALSSAGHRVRLLTQAGTDRLGAALIDELLTWGVLTEHIHRYGTCTPETLIFIDDKGERTIVVVEKDCAQVVPVPYQAMNGVDAVYVGNYGDFEPDLPQRLRSLSALTMTAVPPPESSADWFAHIVVGSSSEFPASWLAEPYEAVRHRVGPELDWVVVTRSEMGAVAYGVTGQVVIPPIETFVDDATGAGDAFAAGILHGLLQGHDLPSAGRLGAHWAAVALRMPQSVPPRWAELGLGDAAGQWAAALTGRLAT